MARARQRDLQDASQAPTDTRGEALSVLCHVPARRRAASAGAVRFAKMHSWQTATSLIALAQIRILQDQANFHIDGEGTMRGAENDPSLDDLA
jgi:hypothetical protein